MADSSAEAAMDGCGVPSSRMELETWMVSFREVPVGAVWTCAAMPPRCEEWKNIFEDKMRVHHILWQRSFDLSHHLSIVAIVHRGTAAADGRDGVTTTADGTDATTDRWSPPAVLTTTSGCGGACRSEPFEHEYGGHAALGEAGTLERRGQEMEGLEVRHACLHDGCSSFYS